MKFEYLHLLPEGFPDTSRVWIYQSSRLLTMGEALEAEEWINKFCAEWRSHGAKVSGYGNLFFGQFLVLMADESATGVSGCSTDSSVHFVKEMGERFKVDFFNRQNLAFVLKDKIQTIPMAQLAYALENGFVSSDTLFFNNTITTRAELEGKWILPLKDSWLAKKLKINAE